MELGVGWVAEGEVDSDSWSLTSSSAVNPVWAYPVVRIAPELQGHLFPRLDLPKSSLAGRGSPF